MMYKTHLAITFFAILLFLTHVSNKFVFILVALIAGVLPDIDTGFSSIGRMQASRIVQFFARHRGIFHSLSFCIIASLVFSALVPVIALPFFLGYSLHLLTDSFTIEGIKPFWPLQASSSWKIKTGGEIETSLFIFFIIADIMIFIFKIKTLFNIF